METNTVIILVGVAIVVAVAIIAWVMTRRSAFRDEQTAPAKILDAGWQFYSKPTTLEPPGTIFRIDQDGRKYVVTVLEVKTQTGNEAFGKSDESVETSIGVVARFLSLADAKVTASGSRVERLEVEVIEPVRELATDDDIDEALDPYMERLKYRADNRYFIICQSRKANGINYRLSKDQLYDLGGEASVSEALSGKGTLLNTKRTGDYKLEQKFPEPMRVMFLPLEIKPIAAGLAVDQPVLGLNEVKEVLVWEEG